MRKTTILLAILTAGLTFLTVWSWKKLNITPLTATHLRLTLDTKVESLDPAKVYSDDGLLLSAQALESLYQYHYLKRPYEIQPLLAEGLPHFTNKGTLVTIKIRKGVYYHPHPAFDGKPRELIAEDFVIQFKRLTLDNLKSPGRGLMNGLLVGFDDYSTLIDNNWERFPQHPLRGVVAKDRYTLQLQLLKREPNITYYLAMNFFTPMPWELIKYQQNNLDNTLIGTGPYLLKEYGSDRIEMEKFQNYREDFYPTSGDRYANVQKLLDSGTERIPFIDKLRFYISSSESKRWDMFFDHEIDLLTVPKSLLSKLYDKNGELSADIQDQEITLKHFPTLSNRWLAFNMRHPIVGKNEYLRRAIAYSIDYSKYIQVISQNTNLLANSILVPGISGYQPSKDFRFKYDPQLAKEYLKLAGFTKPEQAPTIVYSTRGNQSVNLREADFIKEQLEAIGLKVEIQVLSFSEFISRGRAGELMFFTDNWLFDYPDGENIMQLLVSKNFPGINKSGYSNPRVDALYLRLKESTNQDERDIIIREMEEIVFQDLPWIPMMYESAFVLQYPGIKNFRKSSIIRNYIKYLKIEN